MKSRSLILSILLLLPCVISNAQEHKDSLQVIPLDYGVRERKPTFNGGDANEFAIPDAIQYITSKIDNNGPVLVGVDYTGDGVNNHWIVIIGYWQNSTSSIEFQYVETGTGNADYAFSQTNVLSYTIGEDYISGPHWLYPDKFENHVRQVRRNP